MHHDDANCGVYASSAPRTGARVFLLVPTLAADQRQSFLDAFAKAHTSTVHGLLLANSGAHTANRLKLPPNVALVCQPAATPELNPAERGWHDLKSQRAGLTFKDLDALEQELVARLWAYAAATLSALTGYPDVVQAINLIQTIHGVCS